MAKDEVVTFKVDQSLHEILTAIPNRSEFIRSAILAALDNVCPLCMGTGILTPKQKDHWNAFAHDHRVAECRKCHELMLVCNKEVSKSVS